LDSSFPIDFCISVTAGVVGNHIFSDYDFLEVFQSSSIVPENGFTSTPDVDIYIRGRAPALKSILYHTDDSNLFTALRRALNADEYEELKELVHYKLGFQLKIKKKYELRSLVGPQPVRFSLLEFEHLTGLNCDYIEDLENPRCEVTKEMAAF
ncbi:unnamed protein product, partial [Brassica napus]